MGSCAAGLVLAKLLHCIQMVSRSAIPPRPRTEVHLSLVVDVVMIDLLSHNPSNKTIPWCAKPVQFCLAHSPSLFRAKPFNIRAIVRRRENQNWGRPVALEVLRPSSNNKFNDWD